MNENDVLFKVTQANSEKGNPSAPISSCSCYVVACAANNQRSSRPFSSIVLLRKLTHNKIDQIEERSL